MTEVSDAEALICERICPLPARRVALADAAGAILRESVRAERDQPPFDRVTMDGIAIASRDWHAGVRSFEIIGLQAAGAPSMTLSAPGR